MLIVPALPVPPRRVEPPQTAEALYDTLVVRDPAVDHLWAHQADSLRVYDREHRDASDVALEFPTGAGKTLVGLLLADWRRQFFRQRVAYVCPTNQLARQTATKAIGYGFKISLLIESHDDWRTEDQNAFARGDAIAITNYHHVFNRWSRVAADCYVFDDAHSAEPAVAQPWSVQARRGTPLFGALRGVLEDVLPTHLARMLAEGVSQTTRGVVDVVSPTALASREGQIAAAIDARVDGTEAWFPWQSLREGLASALCFVSAHEILIRPFIPPTETLTAFSEAEQRIYMSATLGTGGELERAFGVPRIARIPLPTGWERQGSGRRLVLFPSATDSDRTIEITKASAKRAHRSLIITPSEREAARATELFVPEDMPCLGKDDVKSGFEQLTGQENVVLVLANRYDGLDLPDDACRLIILFSLPFRTHLQERFLFETLRAREVLFERIRTRVTQGMGRATRNRRDHAAVIVVGEDLVDFLSRADVRAAMRPELQAEIGLGLAYADQQVDPLDALDAFLTPDHQERADIERYLQEQASNLRVIPPAGSEELTESRVARNQCGEGSLSRRLS